MLGRILLLVLQLVVAFYATPKVVAMLGVHLGTLQLFFFAFMAAVIVWLTGIAGALVLKDVPRPSPSTLGVAIAAALIFAALTLNDEVTRAVARVVQGGLAEQVYPLIGAVVGYAIKR